jgi:hypothetical protein
VSRGFKIQKTVFKRVPLALDESITEQRLKECRWHLTISYRAEISILVILKPMKTTKLEQQWRTNCSIFYLQDPDLQSSSSQSVISPFLFFSYSSLSTRHPSASPYPNTIPNLSLKPETSFVAALEHFFYFFFASSR